MAVRAGRFRKFFDRIAGFVEMRVGERGDQTVRPVQVVGGHLGRGVAQVGGRIVDVRVERRRGGERAGTERHPHHRAVDGRRIRAHLNRHHMPGAVDANRTVTMAAFRRACRAVRIIWRAFEMRGQQEIDVFEAYLGFRHAAPGNVVGLRRVAGGRRIPILAGVEVALHVPGAGRVVDVILRRRRAERLARVEVARRGVHGAVEMMRGHELTQIGAAQVFAPFAERVGEIEIVDAELVGDRGVAVVGNPAGDPMMPADGLDVPDLVHVGDDHAVRLVRAVGFEQFAQADDALARGGDVWQHEGDDVFLADAARPFVAMVDVAGLAVGRLELDHRIRAEHALVDGDGFGRAHRHVVFVGAGFGQNATIVQNVGGDGVPARIVRQVDFDMAQHTAVVARLIGGGDCDEPFGIVTTGTGIVVAGDDGGAVVACVFADKDRGA